MSSSTAVMRRTYSPSTPGAVGGLAAARAVRVGDAHRLDHDVVRDPGRLARVGKVERERAALVADHRVDERRDHLARRHRRHFVGGEPRLEVGLVRSSCAMRSAIVVRCTCQRSPQPDCLGEEAGEELAQVPVVRGGQRTEPLGTARSSPGSRRAGPAWSTRRRRSARAHADAVGDRERQALVARRGRAVDQRAQAVEAVVGVADLQASS